MKNLKKVGQIEEENSSTGSLENVGETCSELGGTDSRVVGLGWGQQVADSQKEEPIHRMQLTPLLWA